MSTRSLGQLTLDLVTRTGGFTGPLDKAARHTKKTMKDISSSVKAVTATVAASTAAVAAAGAGIYAYTKAGMDSIDTQVKLARQVDATIGELRGVTRAAEDAGIAQGRLEGSLLSYNKRLGDTIRGTGEAKEAYEALGIEASELADMPLPDQLALISDRISQLDSTAARTSIADKLMSGGRETVKLFESGGDAIRDAVQEIEDYGLAIDMIDASVIEAANDALDRTTLVTDSARDALAVELSPVILEVADRFNEAARDAGGMGEAIQAAIESSLQSISLLLDKYHDLRILSKRVEVGTDDMNLAVAEFAREAWTSVSEFLDGTISKVNHLIELFNKLPGVGEIEPLGKFGDSEFMDRIDQQFEKALGNRNLSRIELDDLLDAESPSKRLDEFFDEVERRRDEIVSNAYKDQFKPLDQWFLRESDIPSLGTGDNDDDGSSDGISKAAREAAREIERQQEAYRGLLEELYPVEAMQQQYLEQQQLLSAAYEQGEISADRYADALDRLKENQRSEQEPGQAYDILDPSGIRMDGEEGGYWEQWLQGAEEAFTDFDELAGNTIDNFSSRFGDAFESVIFDAKSLGEATRGVFEGMARSVVNALGEMAAQWLAYQAVQAATQSMATTAQTAAVTQAAATGTSIASAYAPAAAMASLASFGGNAAAATAGITATTAVAEGMALAGMAHDGIDSVPETGTWLLQEGERVTTSETSDKLDRTLDRVIAGQESGGRSGGPLEVNVRNEGEPMAVRRVDDRFEGDQRIIDVVLANVSGEQELHDLITTKYNLGPRGD
ncbi:hypothetical protein FZZ93_01055 [Halomonas eurihalina]|uniref:Uncharacterized protein n=1 Tax=Halomonas eurihalina TaxID=42566 RepID=A0A5D9DDC3_HALER|nr:phage tail tape measure C-terminal domain-containing protein [Halomonas eurihalina]MDR5858221.1 phage tail tape measure C-terminal domain-containing protein [Halomonas eurihalina]TZG41282.1 hypothetical protein FZZ93_01055 [Halomonas eurihalina]